MMIWVEMKPTDQPNKAMYVGVQPDNLTAEEVAQRVGVPDGCFLDGKIITSRDGERRWSIVVTEDSVVPQRDGMAESEPKRR